MFGCLFRSIYVLYCQFHPRFEIFQLKLFGYEFYMKLVWSRRASTYVSGTEGKELMS